MLFFIFFFSNTSAPSFETNSLRSSFLTPIKNMWLWHFFKRSLYQAHRDTTPDLSLRHASHLPPLFNVPLTRSRRKYSHHFHFLFLNYSAQELRRHRPRELSCFTSSLVQLLFLTLICDVPLLLGVAIASTDREVSRHVTETRTVDLLNAVHAVSEFDATPVVIRRESCSNSPSVTCVKHPY